MAAQDIVEILAAQGVLSPEQVNKIRLEQADTGKTFEEIIAENNYASEEALAIAEAKLRNIPLLGL